MGSYWNSNRSANIPKTVGKVENGLKAEIIVQRTNYSLLFGISFLCGQSWCSGILGKFVMDMVQLAIELEHWIEA